MNRFDRSIALLKKGEEIDPFDRSVRDQMYSLTVQAAAYESLPAETAVAKGCSEGWWGAPGCPQTGGCLDSVEVEGGSRRSGSSSDAGRGKGALDLEKNILDKSQLKESRRPSRKTLAMKSSGLLAVMRDRVLSFADKFEDAVARTNCA